MLSGLVRWMDQHVLNQFEDAIASFFGSLEKQILAGGGQLLTAAAAKAVAAAETTGGTGAAKFAAAIAAVKTELTGQGVSLVENAIQGAVLAAVASMQAHVDTSQPYVPVTVATAPTA